MDVCKHLRETEGPTPELEDILQSLDEAAQQLTTDSSPLTAASGSLVSSSSFALAPPAQPGGSRRKWKTAATAVMAVDRMRRTVVFVVASKPGQADQRHAIEIVGLGQTTVAQLRQKIQEVAEIAPSRQEVRLKGSLIGDDSATLTHVGVDALAEISVCDREVQSAQAGPPDSTQGHHPALAHFQSSETMALRAQVQQLQNQLTVRPLELCTAFVKFREALNEANVSTARGRSPG